VGKGKGRVSETGKENWGRESEGETNKTGKLKETSETGNLRR